MQDDSVRQVPTTQSDADHKRFYSAPDPLRYGRESQVGVREEVHRVLEMLPVSWPTPLILELGVGAGSLVGIHPGYIALEYSEFAIHRYLRRTRAICGDMQQLPFRDGSIACVITVAALEHVPFPELVLAEIDRVLRPGGIAYLAPAWFCRPWAAKNLVGRPYRELRWIDRLLKVIIPFRNSLIWRGADVLPGRLLGELRCRVGQRPVRFRYRRLTPNLGEYLTSDSDAFSSMDPHAALMYYVSRGYTALSTPGGIRRLFIRHSPLIVQKWM